MNTELTLEINSRSLKETVQLGRRIGARLKGGEVIELTSDLGGGKTAFVSGLASGAGSLDKVHSPSFTISNQYQSDNMVINHYDLYRLSEPGIIRRELAEALGDPEAVTVVEWAGIIEDVLPVEKAIIEIQVTGQDSRRFVIRYPDKYEYLFSNT